jgi:hypothetical protein
MGTVISLADKSTAWLAPSVAAARQGVEVLRATWQAMAAAGKRPEDIDVSDPDAIDWQRIADVLLTMAEFERWALSGRAAEREVPGRGPVAN